MIPIEEQALLLVFEGQALGVTLRLVGSVGVGVATNSDLSTRPEPVKDIDLVSKREMRVDVQSFLSSKQWAIASELLLFAESRETYCSPSLDYSIDVYYDEIDGNHRIRLRDRIDLQFPTIPVVDLLLTKLQRVSLRPQDLWDLQALFTLDYSYGDVEYVANRLCADWGLYTTAMGNLSLIAGDEAMRAKVKPFLESAIEGRKTVAWVLRSLVGRRLKWWRDIYGVQVEVQRREC